jgi:hypothetical protein
MLVCCDVRIGSSLEKKKPAAASTKSVLKNNKDLTDNKNTLAAATEDEASSEGDLSGTTK